jgi:HTH-type transcriptional repressor of NAD biosynthesis genes
MGLEKPYKHAIVLGKFMNPHAGHEALIRFAMTKADRVRVLLCVTDTDRVLQNVRFNNLNGTFGNSIDLEVFPYEDFGLSGEEESSRGVSAKWADVIHNRYPEVGSVVGSEDYIDYMACSGYFDAVVYDKDRKIHSCSSTAVSKGSHEYYTHYAKDLLARKLYIVGPESTGKTTLAETLSKELSADVVYEAARDNMNTDGSYTECDLPIFALSQELSIRNCVKTSKSRLIISDTSACTTISYGISAGYNVRDIVYDLFRQEEGLYLVMSPDVEWIDDGTRHMNSLTERQKFFQDTLDLLFKEGKPYFIISGDDYNQRTKDALECCKNYLA